MKFNNLLGACAFFLLSAVTADAQQITGTPGSPEGDDAIERRKIRRICIVRTKTGT